MLLDWSDEAQRRSEEEVAMHRVARSKKKRARAGAGSLAGLLSARSLFSILSFGSVGSMLSIGSVLSIGSAGSILSIGSVGSILSIGGAGSSPHSEDSEPDEQ
jgi:hypothetical protein